MEKLEFVLSTERINSYGQIILTDGIDTEDFEKNPIMLWQHERGRVIGKWTDIKKTNGNLLATAIFDETDEFSKSVYNKVTGGFISACSIGIKINPADIKVENDIETVTKSKLLEASLVDIPSNGDAIRRNYISGDINVYVEQKIENRDRNYILLREGGFLSEQEADNLLEIRKVNKGMYNSILIQKERERRKQILSSFNELKRKLRTFKVKNEKEVLEAFFTLSPETAKSFVDELPTVPSIAERIKAHQTEPKKDLNWYRRNDPLALKKDKGLFDRLFLEDQKRREEEETERIREKCRFFDI